MRTRLQLTQISVLSPPSTFGSLEKSENKEIQTLKKREKRRLQASSCRMILQPGRQVVTRSAWLGLLTYDLDSVSRRGSDVPGALLPAGVLVGPVGAAQGPAGAVDLMLALSWTHTETREHTRRKEVKIVAAQEKVRGNRKGT